MRTYRKLTELTAEEQKFAEDNHYVLEWSLHVLKRDYDENYSVAVFGYLKAVQNWFAREDLHKYDFKTIAKWTIKSYLGNEQKKAFRRIQTISLETPIGDEEGLTLMDVITYDNYLNCYA